MQQVEIRAEIDRESNAIRVTTKFVKKFRIYLHDSMLDLDRPISVTVDGRSPVKKTAKQSASVLLESALRDREMLFTAAIDVDVRMHVKLRRGPSAPRGCGTPDSPFLGQFGEKLGKLTIEVPAAPDFGQPKP
ncbi:MAG: hypothetical protein HY716_12825 [Planctomycetes bacterium]|nr:hypothetical protein [Planctomycetota bacterium]